MRPLAPFSADEQSKGKLIMKALVTGGAGFLGSHIADALSEAGHEVVLLDTKPSPYLRPDQTMLVADIRDAEAMLNATRGCDVVYHLAAIADIDVAINDPRGAVDVNIVGTLNMLEAARQCEIKRFIFSSSIYVYSNQGSFYRTTKQACELLIHDYLERFGLNSTIVRFGSLYGPRADGSNAVFRMLTSALTKGRIEYGGTGNEIREYIHIADAAAAAVDVLAPEYENDIIHLMGRERLSTRDMLEMIREIMGGKVEIDLQGEHVTGHYIQTPYTYTPKLGKKLARNTYIDLGLGLLDCIESIHKDLLQEEN